MPVVSMNYLLEAGVHFGHQTRRWNPKMAEYIYTSRDDIYIIDLQKTVKKIEEAYRFINAIAENGGKALFVGTKKQAQEALREEAIRSKSYYVTERWLGGTLTNFRTIRRRINRLEEIERMEKDGTFEVLPKKEVIKIRKEYEKLNKNLGGIRDMKKLPSVLFIVDPRQEEIAILEARKLNIPVVGIVDTNCDPDMVDYVIPANDDAIRAVKLIVGVMANAIVEAQGGEMIDFITDEDKNKVTAQRKTKEKPVVEKEKAKEPEVVVKEEIEEVTEEVKEVKKVEKPKKEEIIKVKEEPAKKEEQKPKKETTKKKDLSTLTLVELKELAKGKGLTGYSKLKKAELIEALNK